MDEGLMGELQAFMQYTRETLSCVKGEVSDIKDKVQAIENHCMRQNGDIKLVMERERDTHACCGKTRQKADENARAIVALRVAAEADKELDRERSEGMRGEVEWLRNNVWKLALGGISLLAVIEQVVGIIGKLNGSP